MPPMCCSPLFLKAISSYSRARAWEGFLGKAFKILLELNLEARSPTRRYLSFDCPAE